MSRPPSEDAPRGGAVQLSVGARANASASASAGSTGATGGAPTSVVDVSIVIVVYKTPEFLRRCLDSLRVIEPAIAWEAIVIDNAPEEGDCRSVAEGRPGVRYVPNARNVGFGRGCNQGMRLATGRYYLMLNPDMEVLPGSIEALLALSDRDGDIGIAAPRLHYGDGRLQESCRTFYTLPIFLLRRTLIGKLFPNSPLIREHLMLDWDHGDTRDVDWCIGACLLVRSDAVADVGMMDERFFMYFEDVDWCYRMRQRGWRVVYHPDARMTHHYQRASAGWKPSRGLLIHLGSTLRYYEKWSFVLYWFKLRSRELRTAALFLSDLVMVLAAFLAAYALRSLASGLLTKPLFGLEVYDRFLAFTAAVAMASFVGFGLYRERMRPTWIENGMPVARALAWTSVIMMASTFLFSVRVFSRVIVLLFFPMAVIFVTTGRTFLLRSIQSMRDRDLNLHRVGLLGPPEAVAELMERFERLGRFGMEPIPLSAAANESSPEALVRRIQTERLREVIVFEDWPGDLPSLLPELRERGLLVRVIPRMRGVLPSGSTLQEFMGWSTISVGGDAGSLRRTPGRAIADLAAAAVLGALWLLPFLAVLLGRKLARKRGIERARLRGRGGRSFTAPRLSADPGGRGFFGEILHWYPALGHLATGMLSLVGIYAFAEVDWPALDPAYRARPPDAPVGLVGPWTGRRLDAAAQARWNQAYPQEWSAAEDFRIFWRAVFSRGDQSGGTP